MLLNGAALNDGPLNGDSADGEPIAGNARPLELGTFALVPTPLVVHPPGFDLVQAGLHTAFLSPLLPSNQSTVAGNVRPLELGAFALQPQAVETTAGEAQPLELGTYAIGSATVAGAAEPLELGTPGPLVISTTVGGAQPLEIGTARVVMVVRAPGFDLVRWQPHEAVMAGASLVAGGADPLEIGDFGPFAYATTTRQQFPLQLGDYTLARGNAC